jgi:hypothetical protein
MSKLDEKTMNAVRDALSEWFVSGDGQLDKITALVDKHVAAAQEPPKPPLDRLEDQEMTGECRAPVEGENIWRTDTQCIVRGVRGTWTSKHWILKPAAPKCAFDAWLDSGAELVEKRSARIAWNAALDALTAGWFAGNNKGYTLSEVIRSLKAGA